jgi:hypothetical protein
MYRAILTLLIVGSLAAACGRNPMLSSPEDEGQGGQGGKPGGGRGGSSGAGGSTVLLQLPDGGLSSLLGDSGILGGILDAPRDSIIGQLICGPEARLGAPCSVDNQLCMLQSLGGACICMNGTYICPLNPSSGPTACPPNARSGGACMSPLAICIGGGTNGCVCLGTTYQCI